MFDERGGATGQYQYQGFKETPAIVQASIEKTMKGYGKNAKLVSRIGPNRFAPELEGMEFDDLDYEMLSAMFLGGDE